MSCLDYLHFPCVCVRVRACASAWVRTSSQTIQHPGLRNEYKYFRQAIALDETTHTNRNLACWNEEDIVLDTTRETWYTEFYLLLKEIPVASSYIFGALYIYFIQESSVLFKRNEKQRAGIVAHFYNSCYQTLYVTFHFTFCFQVMSLKEISQMWIVFICAEKLDLMSNPGLTLAESVNFRPNRIHVYGVPATSRPIFVLLDVSYI
jgi:hypothetical protein